MTDEIEDMRMIAQGSALKALISLLKTLNLAEARLRIALPRERPDG